MIDDKRLAEIAERAERATAGPCDPRVGPTCTPSCWRNSPYCVRHERDLGIFEIAALSDIPDLIAALREAQAENGRLREALRDLVMHATRMLCDYCDLHDDDTKHELFVQPTDKALDAARAALSRDAGREG